MYVNWIFFLFFLFAIEIYLFIYRYQSFSLRASFRPLDWKRNSLFVFGDEKTNTKIRVFFSLQPRGLAIHLN